MSDYTRLHADLATLRDAVDGIRDGEGRPHPCNVGAIDRVEATVLGLIAEVESWKRAAESQNRQWAKACEERQDARADVERLTRERDETRVARDAVAQRVIAAVGVLRPRDAGKMSITIDDAIFGIEDMHHMHVEGTEWIERLQAERDEARAALADMTTERDARVAISREGAAAFLLAYDDADCASVITDAGAQLGGSVVATISALRAHAKGSET